MASSLGSRRMLKDFLVDHELPSCSSTDDLKKSWNPRKPCNKLIRARRRSRILLSHSKAASVSISAGVVHRASDMVINAIKFFPYFATTIKTTTATTTTPAINNYLPRSISRKLSCSSRRPRNMQVLDDHPVVSVNKVVKIKDILRWKSFRDINAMEMEEIMPFPSLSSSSVEFSCSPNQYNSSTTTAAPPPTTITTAGSRRSSTDSTTRSKRSEDFTVDEDLSACCSGDRLEFSKHYLRECPDQGTTVSKRELQVNEEEQHSPVSVLDSPFQEDEAFSFFFQRNLASMERRKCRLMQRIEEFESLGYKNLERSSDQRSADEGGHHEKHTTINDDAAVREKAAHELLSRVKGTAENSDEHSNIEYQVLLDYFIQELTTSTCSSIINGGGSSSRKLGDDGEMLRFAESWLSNNSYKEEEEEERCNNGAGYCWEWEMMEKGLRDSWNFSSSSRGSCFEEEERGLGCKLETMVLNDLVDEILFDLLSIK